MKEKLPVTILTGFLGSGKTTILNSLILDSRMSRTAVIINEFGDIALDHMLVEKADENTYIIDGGCICCTMQSDLGKTLSELYDKQINQEIPPFDRVIVETSGLSDPLSILEIFMTDESALKRFNLQGVVTTVDALHAIEQLDTYEENIKQVAVADRILLTKTDLTDEINSSVVKKKITEVNAGASIIDIQNEPDTLLAFFQDKPFDSAIKTLNSKRWTSKKSKDNNSKYTNKLKDDKKHERIKSFCIIGEKPMKWENTVNFLQDVARSYNNNLLRIKGILNIENSEKPIIIHGVHHYIYPYSHLEGWPDEDTRSRIVFIVQDLEQKEIQTLYDKHNP